MTRFPIALRAFAAVVLSATLASAADNAKPAGSRFGSEPTLGSKTEPTIGPKSPDAPKIAPVKVTPTLLAAGDPALRSTHSDWQVRCDKDGDTEQCALIQSVVAEGRTDIGLSVILINRPGGLGPFMRVLAPLGVMMPRGLGLTIDGRDIGHTGFVKCLASGCIAEVALDPDLVAAFAGGEVATFIIFEAPDEGIGIPIALAGFKAGFDALP